MCGWRPCPLPDPAVLTVIEKMGSLPPWSYYVLPSGDYPFISYLAQRLLFVLSTAMSLGQSILTMPLPVLDFSGGVAEGFQNKLVPEDHGSAISISSHLPLCKTTHPEWITSSLLMVTPYPHTNSC